MNKFIYVFSYDDRENLLNRGFKILKDDKVNSVYIFSTDGVIISFDLLDVGPYILSDVLTF